jgi:hypothetical protein
MSKPMKHLFLTTILGLVAASAIGQTATNFNCADCKGIDHDLFSELDSGKVIVIDWVMPCSSCTGPSLTAYNVVESFQASHPGRVRMYLCDDYANTSCTSLNSWRNNQGLTNATTFSDASISMTDYGAAGMPKVVVLGGSSHSVFFTADFTLSGEDLQQAIEDALAAATGIHGAHQLDLLPTILPNPAEGRATVTLHLPAADHVDMELLDLAGKPVLHLFTGTMAQGAQRVELPTDQLPEGLYLLRLSTGAAFYTTKLAVAR